MLWILDFTRTKIATITDYTDLEIEEDLETGDKNISFTYLGDAVISNEYYVQDEEARYVIKEVTPGTDSSKYRGQLDLEDLQRTPYKKFTSNQQTLTAAATAALEGTGWTVNTSITTKRNVQKYKALPLDILYAIRDAWMCEIAFDNLNKIVYFKDTMGSDRGVYFMRGLNLTDSQNNIDSYDYVTRIIPYGAEGLTIESVNHGIPYVENYQYSTKILTLIWEDTAYTDPQALMDDAIKKLDELSKPKRSYDCDVIDLANMSDEYELLDYDLGDTVKLIDEMTGIHDKQRIVRITKHPDEPERNTCELSNAVLTFEEISAKMRAAADAWDDISNPDGTINGVYVHGIEAEDIVGIETVISENATVQGAVSNVSVLYAQGDSPTTPPTTGWSTVAPAWDNDKYQWQKTETTYVSGDTETSDPTNISGAQGHDGDSGVSVTAITQYYKLQPSSDPAPAKPTTRIPTGWSTTEPAFTPGGTAMTLYTTTKVLYSDDSFGYSDVSVSSTYAAVEMIAVNDYRYSHTYEVNGVNWTFTAKLTHAGVDITDTAPGTFEWYKKQQAGKTLLGTGKTITIDTTQFIYGGSVVGVYTDENEQGETT